MLLTAQTARPSATILYRYLRGSNSGGRRFEIPIIINANIWFNVKSQLVAWSNLICRVGWGVGGGEGVGAGGGGGGGLLTADRSPAQQGRPAGEPVVGSDSYR